MTIEPHHLSSHIVEASPAINVKTEVSDRALERIELALRNDFPFDVFLAGSWTDRECIANDAKVLTNDYGLSVACTWSQMGYTQESITLARDRCEYEIRNSTLFVLDLSRSESTTGGRYVELGMARLLGKPTLCIGEPVIHSPYCYDLPWALAANRYTEIATAFMAAMEGPAAWQRYRNRGE